MTVVYTSDQHARGMGDYDYPSGTPWFDQNMLVVRGFGPPPQVVTTVISQNPTAGIQTSWANPLDYTPTTSSPQYYLDQETNKLYYARVAGGGSGGANISGVNIGANVSAHEVVPNAFHTMGSTDTLTFQVRSKFYEVVGYRYKIYTWNSPDGSSGLSCNFLGDTWTSANNQWYRFTHSSATLAETFTGTGGTHNSFFYLSFYSPTFDVTKHLQPGVWQTVTIARPSDTNSYTIPLYRQFQPFIETRWVPGSAEETAYGSSIAPMMVVDAGAADPYDTSNVPAIREKTLASWWELPTTTNFRTIV